MRADAIVIGAGPNGLTAALALVRAGKQVVVLEAANVVGGHTRALEFAPGFESPLTPDAGWVPPHVAALVGAGAVNMTRFTGGVVVDGAVVRIPNDAAASAELIGKYSKSDAAKWPTFVRRLAKFADVMGRMYQLPAADIDTTSLRELLPLAALGLKVRGLGRADMTEFLRVMPMSVQDLLDDEFETEWLKAAVAAAAIRDLRQGPRSGGTTLNLIHYMVGAPAGAYRRVSPGDVDHFRTQAMGHLTRAGATIRTDARVERIIVRDGAVAGVVARGEQFEAPLVISTADPKRTLLHLMEPQWLDPEIGLAVENVKLRGCTAYVMIGVDGDAAKTFDTPISFMSTTVALEKAADAAKYGEISAEPLIEVWSPSAKVLTARAQFAPFALKAGAWSAKESAVIEKKVIAAVASIVPGFANAVKHTRVLTPVDIEKEFGVTEGAFTQGEMTLDQIMFMRPIPGWGRHAMPIRGLFLGGAGAHPGPGILGGAGLHAAKAAL